MRNTFLLYSNYYPPSGDSFYSSHDISRKASWSNETKKVKEYHIIKLFSTLEIACLVCGKCVCLCMCQESIIKGSWCVCSASHDVCITDRRCLLCRLMMGHHKRYNDNLLIHLLPSVISWTSLVCVCQIRVTIMTSCLSLSSL